ncbi:MAG: hypothetical protein H6698_08290 [Myxococcales bacterium]|nr:hypothetical protein [Myxococcales bacterium]MCB9534288.1 hypothetical protein [Myxococcales bacterium]
MNLRSDLRLSVDSLIALQILTAAGAIVLLSRVAPAVEQILADNDYSIAAAEDMLEVLARGQTADPQQRAAFAEALDRARSNVTEHSETGHLDAIVANSEAALGGDPAARRIVVDAIEQLSEVNHRSMLDADVDARELGVAGAWAMVMLSLLTAGAGGFVGRRLTRRVAGPIEELHDTVSQFQAGERQRRASPVDGPPEVQELRELVNAVLDARCAPVATAAGPAPMSIPSWVPGAMDLLPRAAFVVGPNGAIEASNAAAIDALAGDGGADLRAALRSSPPGADGYLTMPLPDDYWLCIEERAPDGSPESPLELVGGE